MITVSHQTHTAEGTIHCLGVRMKTDQIEIWSAVAYLEEHFTGNGRVTNLFEYPNEMLLYQGLHCKLRQNQHTFF